MNIIFKFILTSIVFVSGDSVSMLGVELYDNWKSVAELNLQVVGEESGIVKYRTNDGNDFSITFENDKVVYMENDWLLQEGSKKPLLTNFTFGKTSIADIRNEFGTNGFTYSNRLFSSTNTHLVTFNCFELDTDKNEVFVAITGIAIEGKNQVNENNISEKLKLLAIIIADKKYLDKIWGEEKVFDKNYKKIKF
jgi:hypothetical protein